MRQFGSLQGSFPYIDQNWAQGYSQLLVLALGLIVQDIVTVIIALAIAFEANWQLSLIILVLLPLLLVNGQVQMGSMQGFVTDAKVCK